MRNLMLLMVLMMFSIPNMFTREEKEHIFSVFEFLEGFEPVYGQKMVVDQKIVARDDILEFYVSKYGNKYQISIQKLSTGFYVGISAADLSNNSKKYQTKHNETWYVFITGFGEYTTYETTTNINISNIKHVLTGIVIYSLPAIPNKFYIDDE